MGEHRQNPFANPWVNAVREFHEATGLKVADGLDVQASSEDLIELRIDLIEEEAKETRRALRKRHSVKIADGLADLIYVTIGAALTFGIPLERVFEEVHRSNMTKIGPDGQVRRREDGKILKPDTFEEPQLVGIMLDALNPCRHGRAGDCPYCRECGDA